MRRGNSCSGPCSIALCTQLPTLAHESTPQKSLEFQGNTWQFKDFHAKDPAQVMHIAHCGCRGCMVCFVPALTASKIFSTVKGFYVQYTESLCDACVCAWNVQVHLFTKSFSVCLTFLQLDRSCQPQQPPSGQCCSATNVGVHSGSSKTTSVDIM